MKRTILAALVLGTLALLVYGFAVTRQERVYRQLLAAGDAALARGDDGAALEAFTAAVEVRPDAMVPYLKRGEAHRRRGDLEPAAADLNTAASLDPGSPRAHELLGDVETARARYEAAAGHYGASVRLDDRPRVLYKLGLALHLADRADEAAEALQSAVAMDARFAEAHYLLGLVLRALDRTREAEGALNHALAVSPGLAPAREALADLYGATGRRAARIAELERLASDGDPARQIQLALAHAESGSTSRALRVLEVAAERHPDHPGVPLALGRLWLEMAGRRPFPATVRSAVDALERAVALDPSGTALADLARARLAAGDLAGASAALARALDALPVDPGAFLALAEEAERLGQVRVARDALVKYHALSADERRRAQVAGRLGDLSARLQEPDTALYWYAAAADGPRAAPAALVRLAEAHLAAGNTAEARAALSRALEQDPDNAAATSLARRVHQ